MAEKEQQKWDQDKQRKNNQGQGQGPGQGQNQGQNSGNTSGDKGMAGGQGYGQGQGQPQNPTGRNPNSAVDRPDEPGNMNRDREQRGNARMPGEKNEESDTSSDTESA